MSCWAARDWNPSTRFLCFTGIIQRDRYHVTNTPRDWQREASSLSLKLDCQNQNTTQPNAGIERRRAKAHNMGRTKHHERHAIPPSAPMTCCARRDDFRPCDKPVSRSPKPLLLSKTQTLLASTPPHIWQHSRNSLTKQAEGLCISN